MKQTRCLLLLLLVVIAACKKDEVFTDDGFWIAGNPADYNFNTAALDSAIQNAAALSEFYALLVVRDGHLVVEKYYDGHTSNSLFQLRSITKNVTSALTGIALADGSIPDADVRLKEYYPGIINGAKDSIRLRDILNMASGLEWDEDQEINPVTENKVSNSVEYLLARNLAAPPGTVFNYNSLSTHVAGDILHRETGRHLGQYAEQNLFEPLNIRVYQWQRDPEGRNWGGFGLQLRARDMAKFGLLYLNKGLWEGIQIVPEAWVQTSASPQIQVSGSSVTGYSYQWWTSSGLSSAIFYGSGYGGQGIFIVPEKNLIVIAFQRHDGSPDASNQRWNNLVSKVFIPIFKAAQ
ncbi:MAG: serine hydrolase [Saprospiraceae bacterium]|nr:serine hydrolase [Lewinellaceae bacterium]